MNGMYGFAPPQRVLPGIKTSPGTGPGGNGMISSPKTPPMGGFPGNGGGNPVYGQIAQQMGTPMRQPMPMRRPMGLPSPLLR